MTIILPPTIKFIITDFDGIITDNCVYIDSKGDMTRKMNFKDIMAISMLKKNGYKIGIISGEKNSAIELVKEKFNIDEVYQDIRIKISILESIVEKYGLSKEEFVYIGDDINDYDSLFYSKYALTVPNAVPKIKNIPHIQITDSYGGDGGFREIVDAVIASK